MQPAAHSANQHGCAKRTREFAVLVAVGVACWIVTLFLALVGFFNTPSNYESEAAFEAGRRSVELQQMLTSLYPIVLLVSLLVGSGVLLARAGLRRSSTAMLIINSALWALIVGNFISWSHIG